jgi:hypothetical protein
MSGMKGISPSFSHNGLLDPEQAMERIEEEILRQSIAGISQFNRDRALDERAWGTLEAGFVNFKGSLVGKSSWNVILPQDAKTAAWASKAAAERLDKRQAG